MAHYIGHFFHFVVSSNGNFSFYTNKKNTNNIGAKTAKSRSKLSVKMLIEELKPIRGMPLKIREIQIGMKFMPVAAIKK
jgi:hypothetical protein